MSRRGRIALAGILVAAAAIRLYRLDHFSYGLDEILQTYWIRGTWSFVWASLRNDAMHPPLDYLVDRFVDALGPSDALRKLPSVAWGVATVGVFAALLRRRAGETAALAGAALLALAPFHVRYSQELRPYSLGLLFLCASLWALDRYLERPGAGRLAALYVACLGAAYSLYTAAFVLALAAGALLAEDALDPDPARRRAARRFLLFSPAFALALRIGYQLWWPVLRDLMGRPPVAQSVPLNLARADRILSFFAFAPDDGPRLGAAGAMFVALAAAGAGLAGARRGTRFLLAWGPGGLVAIEVLGRIHPHYDFARRFVAAGPGISALAAVALAALLSRPVSRLAGAALLTAVLALDARSLRVYFQEGRADWRTLADALRAEVPPAERILTENQYSQLAVAFYTVGPDWLYLAQGGGTPSRSVVALAGDHALLARAWWPGHPAWLVLAGVPIDEPLRAWAARFPCRSFPRAERALLCRLDAASRDASLALISSGHGP